MQLVDPKYETLHQAADINPFSTDIDWQQCEKEMIALMHESMGIGLASPQVGKQYRMFVMSHSTRGDIGVYNPVTLSETGKEAMSEGCLTWPLLYITITRPAEIHVNYQLHDGTLVDEKLTGMDARCFLHECDHLRGVNFIDLVSDFKLKRAKNKRDKFLRLLDKVNVA